MTELSQGSPPPQVRASDFNDLSKATLCPLTNAVRGAVCKMCAIECDKTTASLLESMGLGPSVEFRVTRAGSGPCIVQVGETRIGISAAIAKSIKVEVIGEQPR